MNKVVRIYLFFLLLPAISFAQTQVPENSQSPIYFKDGKVGIGNQNPQAILSIKSGYLNFDWTYEQNWGGNAYKWGGYIGFNSYRNDDDPKDYFYRRNPYTRRFAFEGSNIGFRWLGEYDIPDGGTSTPARQLEQLMQLSYSGNLYLGTQDKDGVYGYGSKLILNGTEWNSDPIELSKYTVASDETQLRIRIGDDYGPKDKFIVGSSLDGSDWKSNFVVQSDGKVGIGIINPTYKLTVDGTISASEVKVSTTPNSDYVFEPDYNLKSLFEVETFIKENKHLPEIPSAEEFKQNGVGLGEMDDMLLRKIEELTLYIIEQNKKIESLEEDIKKLSK